MITQNRRRFLQTSAVAAGGIALGIILVALVAWSRLHLQVHFPSDILYAIAAGTIWAVAFRQLPMWSPKQ